MLLCRIFGRVQCIEEENSERLPREAANEQPAEDPPGPTCPCFDDFPVVFVQEFLPLYMPRYREASPAISWLPHESYKHHYNSLLD